MADLQQMGAAIQDWFRQNITGGEPTQFFQSRITRTPGVVDPKLPADVLATYDPRITPSGVVMNSTLDHSLRQALASEWVKKTGMMRIAPDAQGNTIRHESLHDVYEKGGLDNISDIIGKLLQPGTRSSLLELPVYQRQVQRLGEGTLSNEGISRELADDRIDNPQLKAAIENYLKKSGKSAQLDQFRRLTK